jgi:hypothetical protein
VSTRAATLRSAPGTAIPRRRSGPARPRAVPRAAPQPQRRRQSTESFAAIGRMARRVPDARVLDRLIRGRLWIGLIAGGLVMLVFMQVSLLKLNTGISANIVASQDLERQNAELRAGVSSLDSGQRIQDIAAARGMVMPDDGQLRFLAAGRPGNGERAAQTMTAPDPQAAIQRAQALLAQQQEQAAAAPTTTSTITTTTSTSAGTTSAAPATTAAAMAPPATAATTPTQQPAAATTATPAAATGPQG